MAEQTTAQTIAQILAKVLVNLPLATSLAPAGIALIQSLIATFRGIGNNPNATMADIDAAIAKIEAQSAQIQAQK